MSFFAISAFINAATSTIVGIIVIARNTRSMLNRSFCYFSFSVAFWSYCYFLWQISSDSNSALFWCRAFMAGAVFIPSSFFHFSLVLIGQEKKYYKSIISWYIVSSVFLVLNFTPLFVKNVTPRLFFPYWPTAGVFYAPFLVMFLALTVFSHILMYRAFSQLSGVKRSQIKYIFLGTAIGFLGGATNYPLWYNIPIPPLGNILVSVYVILIAYAIVKYRLMDIKVAVTRASIFLFVYALVLGLPFFIGSRYPDHWIIPTVLAGVFASAGPFIYLFIQRKAEAKLLHEERNIQHLLRRFSLGMTMIRDLKRLMFLIVDILHKSVQAKSAAVYLFSENGQQYLLKNSKPECEDKVAVEVGSPLIERLTNRNVPIVYEVVHLMAETQTDNEDLKAIAVQMKEIGASVIVPAIADEILLGFIVLGERKKGEMYSPELINALTVLGNQSALAIENAMFYEERGKTLADQFQEKRLKSLGEMGSGVAHQIDNRFNAITMASGVPVALLQMKDLNALSREELLKIIEKHERMFKAIESDAMRGKEIAEAIKSYSRTSVEPMALLFDKVITSSLSLLVNKFQTEELNLVKGYATDLHIWANMTTIQDVVTNAIDNSHDAMAKKQKLVATGQWNGGPYTPQLTIRAKPSGNRVHIEIEDNGTGLTDEELDKVFVPFFTTKGANKGTGMGLLMMKQLLEQNQGTIAIKSAYKSWAQIIITLPLATEEQIQAAKVG